MQTKATEADMIGQMEGFPVEVLQKMLERQFEQTGFCDVTTFQEDRTSGFLCAKTSEGRIFWLNVITCRNFDLFFAKHPKSPSKMYNMREAYKAIHSTMRYSEHSERAKNPKYRLVHALINLRSHRIQMNPFFANMAKDALSRSEYGSHYALKRIHEAWPVRSTYPNHK